jgi:hypothetical protein
MLAETKIRLEYEDRYGNLYVAILPLRQTLRDDGKFNVAVTEPVVLETATITRAKIWKLRKLWLVARISVPRSFREKKLAYAVAKRSPTV